MDSGPVELTSACGQIEGVNMSPICETIESARRDCNIPTGRPIRYQRKELPPMVAHKSHRLTPIERFNNKWVVDERGCHVWTARIDKYGYGHFGFRAQVVLAHRWIYEQCKGEIPAGLEIDHLCRNRACVNPDHLEAVTRAENQRRGLNGFAIRTTCWSGNHDITDPANWYTLPGDRHTCRACSVESARRYRARKAAR